MDIARVESRDAPPLRSWRRSTRKRVPIPGSRALARSCGRGGGLGQFAPALHGPFKTPAAWVKWALPMATTAPIASAATDNGRMNLYRVRLNGGWNVVGERAANVGRKRGVSERHCFRRRAERWRPKQAIQCG